MHPATGSSPRTPTFARAVIDAVSSGSGPLPEAIEKPANKGHARHNAEKVRRTRLAPRSSSTAVSGRRGCSPFGLTSNGPARRHQGRLRGGVAGPQRSPTREQVAEPVRLGLTRRLSRRSAARVGFGLGSNRTSRATSKPSACADARTGTCDRSSRTRDCSLQRPPPEAGGGSSDRSSREEQTALLYFVRRRRSCARSGYLGGHLRVPHRRRRHRVVSSRSNNAPAGRAPVFEEVTRHRPRARAVPSRRG